MNEDVLVVIPTRNEADTINDLMTGIYSTGFRNILLVDDSTDKTAFIAVGRGAEIVCGGGLGLGSAIRTGLLYAEAYGYKYAVVIDAGGTHNPTYIPCLVNTARGLDSSLVIASRFMGKHPWYGCRTRLSLFAAWCVKKILSIQIEDVTSGFRCYDTKKFGRELLVDSQSWGHAIQIELLALCVYRHGGVDEIPVSYSPLTNSSLCWHSFLDAALTLWRMFVFLKLS